MFWKKTMPDSSPQTENKPFPPWEAVLRVKYKAYEWSQDYPELADRFPVLKWVGTYRKRDLPGDVIGGVTIALMLIPQSIAYAVLAGLPPIVGLYASILPVLVYGLLGTTGVLTLGPTAITSIMILGSIGAQANSPEEYLVLSSMLALTLGGVYLIVGILRLGFVINLLSRPVVTGYVNAAAILIFFSQVQHILGISVPRSANPVVLIGDTVSAATTTHLPTFILGMASIVLLVWFRTRFARLLEKMNLHWVLKFSLARSGPLIVILVSTIVVYATGLYGEGGVRVIGDLPAGLPRFDLTFFDFDLIPLVFSGALAISFVGLMEGISTAKSLSSRRRGIKIDANQELLAMGAANVASAMTGGLAVTTSISRSAVNNEAGATTGLSSVTAALMMAGVAAVFTPLFFFVPNAALAAVIMVSVAGLIDFSTVRELWRYSKLETLPFIVTIVVVFTTSIEIGIIMGVATSIALHLRQTIQPKLVQLGRLWNSEIYRPMAYYDTQVLPEVLVIRIDESLYFANVQYVERYLRNMVSDRTEVTHLVLVCSAINTVDASALQVFAELIMSLEKLGVVVYLAELKDSVYEQLARANFIKQIGQDNIFRSTHKAVEATGHLMPDELLPI